MPLELSKSRHEHQVLVQTFASGTGPMQTPQRPSSSWELQPTVAIYRFTIVPSNLLGVVVHGRSMSQFLGEAGGAGAPRLL